jgi:hypothetical protein
MKKEKITEILENSFSHAIEQIDKNEGKVFFKSLKEKQIEWINIIANNTENLKAITTVLTTSLVKKNRESKARYKATQT